MDPTMAPSDAFGAPRFDEATRATSLYEPAANPAGRAGRGGSFNFNALVAPALTDTFTPPTVPSGNALPASSVPSVDANSSSTADPLAGTLPELRTGSDAFGALPPTVNVT